MTENLLNRRTLLIGSALVATAACTHTPTALTKEKVEKTFLWGSAGASYQIEGGNYASDVSVLERVKPQIFREPAGDAMDTYHRFDEDIKIAASLGFNCHRFSIEWSRIEPEPGQISLAGLSYYRRVLESIHRHGMVPFLTYNHFTTPRWFAAQGGFSNKDGIEPFVRFCRIVTEHLGDLIGIAATFNEPNLLTQLSWLPKSAELNKVFAAVRKGAQLKTGIPTWSAPMIGDWQVQQPIMIEAHNKAYDAIKAASGNNFPVGITLALADERAPKEGPNGIEQKHKDDMYPWLDASGDFIGVQNYTYSIVGPHSDIPIEEGVELTQMGYPFAPEALENVIRTVARHTDRPIYVTENGVATEDDTRRVAFIERAVQGVLKCKEDGIDVRGYLHWSLLDNWEWNAGYGPKFGLVDVNRETFERTLKPSAKFFGEIAKTGKLSRGH